MKTKPNRRQRVLIDLPVQIGVAVRLIALWAVMTLLTAATGVLVKYFGDPATSLLDHLVAPANWAPSLVAFAVVSPIAVLYLVRFSHRIAGPVFRLRSELRQLANGAHNPPLKFRDKDYWTDMAADFNAVADRLWAAEQRIAELESASPAEPGAAQNGQPATTGATP